MSRSQSWLNLQTFTDQHLFPILNPKYIVVTMNYVFWQAKFPSVCISDCYFKINLIVASKIPRKNTVDQDPEICASLIVCRTTIFSIYPGLNWSMGTIKMLSVKCCSLQKSSLSATVIFLVSYKQFSKSLNVSSSLSSWFEYMSL